MLGWISNVNLIRWFLWFWWFCRSIWTSDGGINGACQFDGEFEDSSDSAGMIDSGGEFNSGSGESDVGKDSADQLIVEPMV